MKGYSTILALLILGGSFCVAQDMPQQKDPQQGVPQTQRPPIADQDKTATDKTTTASTGLQSDIQAALQKEPTLASANINVQVTDKNVELSGTVPNRDAKSTAERIAKANAGGLDVKNHLKVEENPGRGPR